MPFGLQETEFAFLGVHLIPLSEPGCGSLCCTGRPTTGYGGQGDDVRTQICFLARLLAFDAARVKENWFLVVLTFHQLGRW